MTGEACGGWACWQGRAQPLLSVTPLPSSSVGVLTSTVLTAGDGAGVMNKSLCF